MVIQASTIMGIAHGWKVLFDGTWESLWAYIIWEHTIWAGVCPCGWDTSAPYWMAWARCSAALQTPVSCSCGPWEGPGPCHHGRPGLSWLSQLHSAPSSTIWGFRGWMGGEGDEFSVSMIKLAFIYFEIIYFGKYKWKCMHVFSYYAFLKNLLKTIWDPWSIYCVSKILPKLHMTVNPCKQASRCIVCLYLFKN